MNDRERFSATMHYQACDRAPLYDFNYWDETIPAWQKQGLPACYSRENVREFFGLDSSLGGGEPADWGTGVRGDLWPLFESKILSDDGDVYTQLQSDGVIVQRQRSSVSIPMHVGHTLADRGSWRAHYLPRLNPDDPARLPEDWARRATVWNDPARAHPVFVNGGSLFGRIRDWMGIENLALVIYDDPAWFEEMVETVADLNLGLLEKIFATGGRFDGCSMWEDMCYNAGPLLSPAHFRKYLVPHYRRITDLCRRHGVDVIWVDCDGKIDELIPLWLDGGVNCMFPIEIGTWGADPVRYRREYGRDLLMMGGFDKHILQRSKQDITDEVNRLAPLVEQGGYIAFADHRVPPDVMLDNYVHYMNAVRKTWGKGISLKPMREKDHAAPAAAQRGSRWSEQTGAVIMTPLERVKNVVAGRAGDHLPAQPIVTKFAAKHAGISYIDYTKDARRLAEAQLLVAEDFGIDCVIVRSDAAREVADIGGGDSIDWSADGGPLVNPERAVLMLPVKLRELRTPDPFGGGRMHDRIKAIEILRAKAGSGQSVVGWLSGPFSLAAGLRGLDRLKSDLQHDLSFANDLLDFTAEVAVRFADAQIRSGADTIGVGDSAAAGISAELYEQHLFPRQKRILEAIKNRHPSILMRLHMCGQIEPLLPKLGQLPFDIYDVDSVVDLAKARAWLGQGRVILGNVSPTGELLDGTPKKVFDSARKCHKACGAYHIVAAGCEVSPLTPPENLKALIRYAREHPPVAGHGGPHGAAGGQ